MRITNPITTVKTGAGKNNFKGITGVIIGKHTVLYTSCDTSARVQWLSNDGLTRSPMGIAFRGSLNCILSNFL